MLGEEGVLQLAWLGRSSLTIGSYKAGLLVLARRVCLVLLPRSLRRGKRLPAQEPGLRHTGYTGGANRR